MTVAFQSNTRDGHAGKISLLAIVASAAVIAGSLVFTGPSARAESVADDGVVTTEEIAAALQNIGGDLVKEPVAATSTPLESTATGADTTESETLEIGIPTTASEGVSLSVGDFALDIGLPNAGEAGQGQSLADGSVAYPSDGASANAVIPTDGGVQLLSIIESNDASESYPYELSLPAGHRLEATADGGAQIVDEQGAAKVVFEPAWAQDAAGQSVPTHYSVEGNTLTQVVEHKGLAGVSYPIVADPLPVVVIVITTVAMIVVAALALGVATWLVVNWWNVCRAQGKYPELSTKNGFTARCVY